MSNHIIGYEGSVGPGPRQYGQLHVYARDVHGGAGNCVCGGALGDWRHTEAAPGVPVPEWARPGWKPPGGDPQPDCVFCDIVAGQAPATVLERWPDALVIVPLNPVTPGHVLVIPRRHVTDYTSDPQVSAATVARAAEYASQYADADVSNLITSAGAAATQTVFHLHLHVVPRRPGDGLALPWSKVEVHTPTGGGLCRAPAPRSLCAEVGVTLLCAAPGGHALSHWAAGPDGRTVSWPNGGQS